MPTFNEERYRLHKEVQAIRDIIWQEWKRTAIGRLLVRVLRIEEIID
jgi:hypothetical protein